WPYPRGMHFASGRLWLAASAATILPIHGPDGSGPGRQVMKQVRRRILRLAPAAVAAACAFRSASARADAGWPTRPVRVIVPFPPGGGTDILARLVAQRLGGRLGAEFYVENVAGAGGNTGAGVAARA